MFNICNGEIKGFSDAKMKILMAGLHFFAIKGYASTSVREITEEAKVTKPVLYYYFKSKEGLFRAILEWADTIQKEMLDSVWNTPGTTLDRFIAFYDLMYQGITKYENLFKMIHNLLFGPVGIFSYCIYYKR